MHDTFDWTFSRVSEGSLSTAKFFLKNWSSPEFQFWKISSVTVLFENMSGTNTSTRSARIISFPHSSSTVATNQTKKISIGPRKFLGVRNGGSRETTCLLKRSVWELFQTVNGIEATLDAKYMKILQSAEFSFDILENTRQSFENVSLSFIIYLQFSCSSPIQSLSYVKEKSTIPPENIILSYYNALDFRFLEKTYSST